MGGLQNSLGLCNSSGQYSHVVVSLVCSSGDIGSSNVQFCFVQMGVVCIFAVGTCVMQSKKYKHKHIQCICKAQKTYRKIFQCVNALDIRILAPVQDAHIKLFGQGVPSAIRKSILENQSLLSRSRSTFVVRIKMDNYETTTNRNHSKAIDIFERSIMCSCNMECRKNKLKRKVFYNLFFKYYISFFPFE